MSDISSYTFVTCTLVDHYLGSQSRFAFVLLASLLITCAANLEDEFVLFVAARMDKSSIEELPCERDTSDGIAFEDVALLCLLWLLTEGSLLLLSRIKGTK